MTTDTRPLSERVADILATEDCVVTPLLREAMSELADRDAQIEMRGNMIRQLEGYIDGFKTQLEALGAEVRALRFALQDCISLIRRTDCSDGVCMCGTEIALHTQSDNHAPVDNGDYCKDALLSTVEPLLDPQGSPGEPGPGDEG
jgi:hypothetical protein